MEPSTPLPLPTTITSRAETGATTTVVMAFADRLLRDGVFLPDELVATRVLIKQTGSRKVERVTLRDGGCLVVKRYPPRKGIEGFGRALLGGAAAAEWRNGRALLEAGLPCAEPVAFGEEPSGATVLAQRDLEGARDLNEIWKEGGLAVQDRRTLVVAFGGLLRDLHDAGVAHEDPHFGNFMVSVTGDGFRVVPIDLRRLRRSSQLSRGARLANLLLFHQGMGQILQRTDRLRFLKSYLKGAPRSEIRSQAEELEVRAEGVVRRYRRRRARAALDTNRRFEEINRGSHHWHVRRTLVDSALETVLEDPESAFTGPDEVLKEGRSAQVVVRDGWVVKRMRPRHRGKLVLDRLRLGKARHAIRMAFLLEISGIPTPRVAAAGRSLVGGVVERSYVVTERVPGARHVDRALCELEGEARQGLLWATGELVGRLHREGLAHRDLKAGNLLVAGDGSLVLVDLDGVRSRRSVTLSRAARDLARLFRDLRARAAVTRDDEGTLLGGWSEVTGHNAMSVHERIEREPRLRAASEQGT